MMLTNAFVACGETETVFHFPFRSVMELIDFVPSRNAIWRFIEVVGDGLKMLMSDCHSAPPCPETQATPGTSQSWTDAIVTLVVALLLVPTESLTVQLTGNVPAFL